MPSLSCGSDEEEEEVEVCNLKTYQRRHQYPFPRLSCASDESEEEEDVEVWKKDYHARTNPPPPPAYKLGPKNAIRETMFDSFRFLLVKEGFSPARRWVIEGLIPRYQGVIATVLDDTTTHVVAASWQCATRPGISFYPVILRHQIKHTDLRVISYEWICACIGEGRLVDEKEYNLVISIEMAASLARREAEYERQRQERELERVLGTASVEQLAKAFRVAVGKRKRSLEAM